MIDISENEALCAPVRMPGAGIPPAKPHELDVCVVLRCSLGGEANFCVLAAILKRCTLMHRDGIYC